MAAKPLVWRAWVRAETVADRLYRRSPGWPDWPQDAAYYVADGLDWLRRHVPCRRHDWLDDQCGLPEHRYCGWCGRTQGQAVAH